MYKLFFIVFLGLFCSQICLAQNCFPFEKEGKWGYEDKNGKVIVNPKYDYANVFTYGLASVMANNKYGWIDTTGKEVIPLKYDYLMYDFGKEDPAVVQLGNKMTLVSKKGKEVIPYIYDIIGSFNEGLAAVGLNDKWGFIDQTGNVAIPLIYQHVDDFGTKKSGKVRVKLDEKAFFIDKNGKTVE